jgi:hypothetical protein
MHRIRMNLGNEGRRYSDYIQFSASLFPSPFPNNLGTPTWLRNVCLSKTILCVLTFGTISSFDPRRKKTNRIFSVVFVPCDCAFSICGAWILSCVVFVLDTNPRCHYYYYYCHSCSPNRSVACCETISWEETTSFLLRFRVP